MTLPHALADFFAAPDTIWLLAIDAVVKATILLAAAAVACVVLRRASAAVRHFVWTLALVGALALPALALGVPRWQLPVLTLTTSAVINSDDASAVLAPAPPVHGPTHTPEPAGDVTAPAKLASPSTTSSLISGTIAQLRGLSWGAVALVIWTAGFLAVVGRLVTGLLAVQWVARRHERVTDAPWLPLARELATEIGARSEIAFLRSRRATMPMAWGVLKPSVLMPADADSWPVERLRIVLLHEFAHVRRRDCLTHIIAQLACALYWFNPLVWVAARNARTERERACDDLVLGAGTHGPDYAEELLEMARAMRSGRFPAILAGATLAMAHRSQLEGRLIAILDTKTPRSGMTAVGTAALTVVFAIALMPLASVQPWVFAAAPQTSAPFAPRLDEASPQDPIEGQVRQAPVPKPNPQPKPVTTVNAQAVADSARDDRATHAKADGLAQDIVSGVVEPPMAVVDRMAQGLVESLAQGVARESVENIVGSVLAANPAVEHRFERAIEDAVDRQSEKGRSAATDPRTIAALTAALKDTDKNVRETALRALVKLRDPAIFEPLVQALRDAAADVREQAAHALGQLRDRRAVDPLVAALKDQNPGVREHAVFALGQLRDPRSIEGIMSALKDETPDVREQAAFALGQIRDPRAVDALATAMKDTNPSVRERAAFALGQIRDRRAAAALASAISDSNGDVREQAVFALGQLRDASAIEGLTTALRDAKPNVREQAAFALGQIRDRRAVEPLVSALKDSSSEVRHQAAFALGQIRDRAAVDGLTAALKDPSASVRQQAAFALGQIDR
jgi:HEAT repeat protein/beta-lactamase regulating signal transducer with metallopeptidase domain